MIHCLAFYSSQSENFSVLKWISLFGQLSLENLRTCYDSIWSIVASLALAASWLLTIWLYVFPQPWFRFYSEFRYYSIYLAGNLIRTIQVGALPISITLLIWILNSSCELDTIVDLRCLIRGPLLLPGEKQEWQHVGKATVLGPCRGNQKRLEIRQKLTKPDFESLRCHRVKSLSWRI